MKKFVLYTARFGGPGRFNIPEVSIPDVDRFCFTDLDIESGCHQKIPVRGNRHIKNDFYEVIKMDTDHLSPVRKQRQVKICIPDEIFDNYEYSVYVDCKRPLAADFEWLLSFLIPDSDFATRLHRRKRDCIYEEGKICIERGMDNHEDISRQLDFYRSEEYPVHNGLYWTTILFRRHTERLKTFSMFWWKQLEEYSHRDQISLPYVAWKHRMKISVCPRGK